MNSAIPCPTCDYTMPAIGCKVTDMMFYWCPRCGTIKPCDSEVVVPMLMQRLCTEQRKGRVQWISMLKWLIKQ